MDVYFKSKELRKCAESERLGMRKLGALRYEIFIKRISDLIDCETLADTVHLSGNFHELHERRKGQFACSLDNPYRLIYQPTIKPIPTKDDGAYDLSSIREIEIIEICNYHGK